MKKVVIFGGTGFIGQSLANHLASHGYECVLIGRNKPKSTLHRFVKWDAETVGEWASELEHAAAIVNLAGKSVNCIKTPENCDLILRSRVESTKTIGKALEQVINKPTVWVQMSTAHIYGDPPHHQCTEESATGYGLAPFVGKAWEQAFHTAKPIGMRAVMLRTSFVIGRNGGALESLSKMTKLGLGGRVGHGKQGFSWIHEHDMNEIFRQAIEQESFQGIYNATGPTPVSQAAFMKQLRKVLGVPIGLPAPTFLTRIGAKYIFKTDPDLAIYGRYILPKRLQEQGFTFRFSELQEALENLTEK